jgi:NTE family protein
MQSMKRDKVALVLAGGGITGAVYEVGALRAIEDMLVNYTVQDFDIYVGTSAGALVSSLIVNGFSPTEIMQILDKRHPEIQSMGVGDLFQTNIEGIVRRATRLPKTLYNIGRNSLHHLRDVALSDILWEFANILPVGLYNGQGLEKYVRTVLEERAGINRFDQLEKTLFIIATELETGKRAVFGQGGKSIVPISQAVAASSAVPILYQPVEIFHRDYIDGGLHGSASIDLAIEAGAKLVVCINPMVPLDTTGIPGKQHYVREKGLQAITNQSVRTLLHAGVRYHIKNLRVKYPDVDIIVVEPQPDDYRMFSYNPMYFGSRLTVAEHGFESVTVGLLDNFEYFQQVLLRHDIQLTKDLVAEELTQIRTSGDDPKVVQQIIERRDRSRPVTNARVDLGNSIELQESIPTRT